MNRQSTAPIRSTLRHASSVRLGHLDRQILGPVLEALQRTLQNVPFQRTRRCTASSQTESKVDTRHCDNLADANSHSHTLSYTAVKS